MMHIAEFVFCQTQISDHQSWFTQNLKIVAVRKPASLKSKFGQNRPLTLF